MNETERARRTAERLGSEHHEVTLGERDVSELAPALLAGLDQPLGDRAVLPLHALSRFARPRVTVALGGEGADELFGGYPRYRWLERSRRVEHALGAPASRTLGTLARAGARRAGRGELAARRLAPGPLLARNLDWATAERRAAREALYGPRLRALDSERVLARHGSACRGARRFRRCAG